MVQFVHAFLTCEGLIASREVAALSSISVCAGAHSRDREFLDFGNAEVYRKELVRLRAELKP